MSNRIQKVKAILERVSISIFMTDMRFRVEHDNQYRDTSRVFIQVVYDAPCVKTGLIKEWHGRKYYLSDFMTADEIIKTAYVAFESAVKHEIMEGFKVDRKVLFNPHVDFEELLKISDREINRETKI